MRTHRLLPLLGLVLGLALAGPAWAGAQRISADSVAALEARKLQMEVEQMENKDALSRLVRNRTWGRMIGVLSAPLVSTIITLGIGGLLFSVLADRRARRGHNLDKALETVDRVASDLNGVLTPLFKYIRRGNMTEYSPPVSATELGTGRRRAAARLEAAIEELYSKRFAVAVQAEAFFTAGRRPWRGARPTDFAEKYRLLVKNIEMIVRTTNLVYANPQGHGQAAVIREQLEGLIQRWPLDSDVRPRPLTPPFDELNRWTEEVAARSVDLFTSTLRHLLR